MQRTGIKDVAALAGVSIKTVSRVMNGEDFVHAETRARVLDAVQKLGYVPNTAARSLKSGRGDSIGIVIDSLADEFFAALVSAIEARAVSEGLSTLVASTGVDAEREREHIMSLIAGHQVAGLILAPVADAHPYLEAYRSVRPVIAVDRPRDYLDSVVVDDRAATRAAIEQFLSLGHRRIAFYDRDERFLTVQRRWAGYVEALEAAGLEVDDQLVAPMDGGERDYLGASRGLLALDDPATAIFASNARAAIGLARSLHQLDRSDVAVISFGDFSLADALQPAISYIDQDPFRIGNAAIERLLEVRDAPAVEPVQVVVPTSLVGRGSGEIRPVAVHPGGAR